MAQLGKTEGVWFEQWKSLLHGLAKYIWIEVLGDGDPEDDGQPFDPEDGFIKSMERNILQFSPKKNAKTCQLKAMACHHLMFKRGADVAEHITWLRQILKYADQHPGRDTVQLFDSKMIISETSPTTWKQTFFDKSIDSFNSCRMVDIIQHMDQSATKVAYNDEKNKRKTRTIKTMVNVEEEAGKANKTER